MSAESFTSCERLLSATANGVYQGILVAALAGLTLRFFPRTNAATRHAVWFGVLLFMTALIPVHLYLSFRPRPVIPTATPPPAPSLMAAALAPLDEGNPAEPPMASVPLSDPQPVEPDAGTEIDSVGGRETGGILKPFSWNLETAISLPHSICLALVCAWILLAGVRGGLMARRLAEVRSVKKTSHPPSQGLQTLFERLRRSLAAGRNVRLRISRAHRSAVVLGFARPVVLLPSEMDRDAHDGEVEQVLRHELAHVDRRDDWGNLAQQTIQAALFFHPAVWWISAKISLEREIACDDHVLEASGSPRAYALTLANVASRMSHCRHLLAPGVSSNNSQLQQRITMILNTNRDISPRLAKNRLGFLTTATAVLAVLAINAGPRLVLAQSQPETAASIGTATTTTSAFGVAAGLPPDGLGPESGPRSKPDTSDDVAPPAAPAYPATTSVAPAAPVAASPASPASPALPAPPSAPSPRAHRKNMSIEERLDRLERALERLEAHNGAMGRVGGSGSSSGSSYSVYPGGSGAGYRVIPDAHADMELKQAADGMKRAIEQAQRDVEAGQRAAEASQRTAEQAMRDMAKLKTKDYERMQQKFSQPAAEAPLRELEALRSARESLEKELQNISRQIKRLEQDQNHLKNPAHIQPDDPNGGPKAEYPAPLKTL